MTTPATMLACYSAVEGAQPGIIATVELHHRPGHDLRPMLANGRLSGLEQPFNEADVAPCLRTNDPISPTSTAIIGKDPRVQPLLWRPVTRPRVVALLLVHRRPERLWPVSLTADRPR